MPIVTTAAPAEGFARVTVRRSESALFLAVSADVTVNDQRAGSIWRGESTSADVPAGPVSVAVTGSGNAGRSVVRLPAVPGGRYTIEAVPTLANAWVYGMAGGDQSGPFTLAIVSADPPVGTQAAPTAATPVSAAVPASPAEREARLAELRRLRDRGLITEDVYRDEQRRVLAR